MSLQFILLSSTTISGTGNTGGTTNPLSITGVPGDATVGVVYSFVPTVTGGSGTKAFTLTGSLPAGLSFSSTTGIISGTPTSSGSFAGISVKVTDTSGNATLSGLSIAVSAPRYMFASTRLTQPQLLGAPDATQLSRISKIFSYTPDYLVYKMRPVFTNFAVDGGGASTQEFDPTSPLTIDGACLAVGTTTYPITFGGSSSVVIQVGDTVVGDDVVFPSGLAARSKYFTITADTTEAGKTRPAGLARLATYGEGVECTATPQLAKVSATATIATGTNVGGTNNAAVYGPTTWIATGHDGREVILIHGDSMVAAAIDGGNAAPLSGVSGFAARGFDSVASSSIRMPHLNLGLTGSRASQMSTRGAGAYRRRGQMMDAIRAVNLATTGVAGPDGKGLPPFTCVLSEHINNDTGSTAGNTGTGLLAVMNAWWTFLRAEYPTARIIQTSAMPNAQSTDGSKWITLAGQNLNVANDRPSSGLTSDNMRWFASDSYMATPPAPLFGVLDVAAAIVDPVGRAKWKLRPFTALLTSAHTAGSTTVVMDTAPTLGATLVLDYSGANASGPSYVTAVTGSGPYTVTVNAGFALAHGVGTTVRESSTIDGAHASPLVHAEVGDAVIVPAKLNGMFRTTGAV